MLIKEQFEKYHQRNPQVYELFKRFALEAIKAGYKILSAKFIFERIRWETLVVTRGEQWKVNNNYTAYYARMFMEDFPELGSSFRVRTVR